MAESSLIFKHDVHAALCEISASCKYWEYLGIPGLSAYSCAIARADESRAEYVFCCWDETRIRLGCNTRLATNCITEKCGDVTVFHVFPDGYKCAHVGLISDPVQYCPLSRLKSLVRSQLLAVSSDSSDESSDGAERWNGILCDDTSSRASRSVFDSADQYAPSRKDDYSSGNDCAPRKTMCGDKVWRKKRGAHMIL